MASKVFASPLVRHVTIRTYAQTAPALEGSSKISSTILPSKTIVAAVDNGSPITRVTIAFKAGSRYEHPSDLGVSHVMRSAAGLTTSNASNFIISRKLAQIGAAVSASGDREFIYYTLEATQSNLQHAIELLNNVVSCQEFRPWELDDNVGRLKHDLATLPPQARAVDLLHKAAFRRGLGNSLFISPKRIGKVSSESIKYFANNTLTANSCAVVVVGDTQDRASLIAQNLHLNNGTVNAEVSCYHGGELRKEMGGDLAHIAVAFQGAKANTPQSLALAIAAKALGNGPVTKWGADNTPLGKAIGNIGPFAAAGFSASYSDNGLFGIVLTVPKDEAGTAVINAVKFLKCPSLCPETIITGKNQLKLQLLSEADDGSAHSESLAAQALYTGRVVSAGNLAKMVDQISNEDVIKAVAGAINTKLSIGAAGNLALVPYADEI